MELHIRSHPQVLDAGAATAVEAVHLPLPGGTTPLSAPRSTPRVGSLLEALRRVRALRPRRWHIRHRWEITGGDDAHQLAFSCTTCGRTRRSLQRAARPTPAPDVELRRMR